MLGNFTGFTTHTVPTTGFWIASQVLQPHSAVFRISQPHSTVLHHVSDYNPVIEFCLLFLIVFAGLTTLQVSMASAFNICDTFFGTSRFTAPQNRFAASFGVDFTSFTIPL